MGKKVQFFVSFVSDDDEYGMWVYRLLEFGGYTVTGGSNLASVHPEALLSVFSYAEKLVPVLSPSAIAAPEQEFWELLHLSNPGNVVPVLAKPCSFPGYLGEVVSIDMAGNFESSDAANSSFLGQVDAALRGRGRPEGSPRFPG